MCLPTELATKGVLAVVARWIAAGGTNEGQQGWCDCLPGKTWHVQEGPLRAHDPFPAPTDSRPRVFF